MAVDKNTGSNAVGATMENYYISQSKNLDVRSNNAQIVEYIPIEEVAPSSHRMTLG